VKKRHPSGNSWPEFRSLGGGCWSPRWPRRFWPALDNLLIPQFHQEHRPSTKTLHRTRLLAPALNSPKDFLPHSFKTVRLQVALGHPGLLFLCGFHPNALWQICTE
jgi:hypothetical protein